MCLIAFAYRGAPGIELIVAANRDEFFERPTAPAAFWTDQSTVLAGRDLRAGGTWLGLSRNGRFAAITNYRNPRERLENAPSRGALVGDFLTGRGSAGSYARDVTARAQVFNGFSLLVSDREALWFCSNKDGAPYAVTEGLHGLSNHLLDEPWPKVRRAKQRLGELIGSAFDAEDCFELLADDRPAPDAELPDTGISRERERVSSAIFIRDPVYGTRCSTVVIVRDSGDAEFHERSFAPGGRVTGTVSYSFTIER